MLKFRGVRKLEIMPSKMKSVQLLSDELYDELIRSAQSTGRKRTNYNFHESMEENPHRFLNVMLKGTYITPHRHLNPPKSESFILLKGRLAFFIFDDEGKVCESHILSPEKGYSHGIDIAPGIWHTLAVMTDSAVCFEVKPGPYRPTDDKEFAPWAPEEGSEGCAEYLAGLVSGLS